MTPALAILAVDDEHPALEDISRLLRDDPRVGFLETASSGGEALQKISEDTYNAIFLDVRMPGLDGVELARVLRRFAAPPAIVFVTAYETAAVEAFELRAVDYLLKPVSRSRIDEALNRILALRVDDSAPRRRATDLEETPLTPAHGQPPAGPIEGDVVPVDNLRGGGTRLLPRSSILCLQSHGDYVRILAESGRFLLRSSLGEIERRWEPHGFVRVHRRYIVNLRQAVELRPLMNGTAVLVLSDKTEVPVARRQVGELRRKLQA
jgi:DNA-binding LytR/AlgR family response regulator